MRQKWGYTGLSPIHRYDIWALILLAHTVCDYLGYRNPDVDIPHYWTGKNCIIYLAKYTVFQERIFIFIQLFPSCTRDIVSYAYFRCTKQIGRQLGNGNWFCYNLPEIYHRINTKTTIRAEPWWRHQMETFSASLALCVANSPVTDESPPQRPVMRSSDAFFDLCLNKRLSKQL